MSTTIAILSVPIFGIAILWLVLVAWTFRRLRVRHTAAYEAIGSPSLIWNNSMRHNWLFAKFIVQGQWRLLGDPQLAVIIRTMQMLFVAYVTAFIALVALIFINSAT